MMKSGLNKCRRILIPATLLGMMALISPFVYAQEPTSGSEKWEFSFIPYLWFTSLNGESTVFGQTVDIDASFGDILSNSDSVFAFNGVFEVRKGPWGGYLDGTYVKLGTDDSKVGPFTAGTENEMGLFEFGGFYRFAQGHWGSAGTGTSAEQGRRWSLDALAGGRFTSQRNEIEFKTGPSAGSKIAQSESWTDPIIGLRAITELTPSRKWDFRLKGDIGGFGMASDFTWNIFAMFGYNFQWRKLDWAALVGYRALYQDFETGSGADKFKWDVTQHGPVLGLSIGW